MASDWLPCLSCGRGGAFCVLPSRHQGTVAAKTKRFLSALHFLIAYTAAFANPIPAPVVETLDIRIAPSSYTLRARVDGTFLFLAFDDFPTSMSFPVPPESRFAGAWQGNECYEDVPIPWEWISDRYETILPEMPSIPMLRWFVRFPIEIPPYESQARFRAIYEHDLIRRPDEFIFFYATGSGKYMVDYPPGWNGLWALFTITLPPGYEVRGVWLNDDPHSDYWTDNQILLIGVESDWEPVTRDPIVSLAAVSSSSASVWIWYR